MKKILTLSLVALTAGCMSERPMEMSAEAQSELASQLGDRVAGPPQTCVSQRHLRGNRSVGEGAIIFRTLSSDLIYVNRPPSGCPEIRQGRALKTRTTGTQLCAGDIVQVFDPVTNIDSGGCALGDFTPYRRAR